MDKEVRVIVRRLFKMHASGKYSMKQLAIWCNAAGLRRSKDGHLLVKKKSTVVRPAMPVRLRRMKGGD